MIEGGLDRKRRIEDHTTIGGRRLLSPSTNTDAKYCQPHRSGKGSTPTTNQDTWTGHQEQFLTPAASQGGRRRGTNDVSGGDDYY